MLELLFLVHWGDDTSWHILHSGDEEPINILQSFETEKTPKKAPKVIN